MKKNILWHGKEVQAYVNGEGFTDWAVGGISINSKLVSPGDLFIAMPGEKVDGHSYIDEAFSNGAIAALVNNNYECKTHEHRLIHVKDTMAALRSLASVSRKRFKGKIIAVTGSVGKTTMKTGIHHVLSKISNTYASSGSFNSQIGHPLCLALLPADSDYAVFELGMSEKGGLSSLVSILQPHAAIITVVSPVHMESFNDLSDVMYTKLEVFKDSTTKIGILNRDISMYRAMKEKSSEYGIEKIITFGSDKRASVRIKKWDGDNVDAIIEMDYLRSEKISYKIANVGEYWAKNSAGIIASAMALGVCPFKAAEHLHDFYPISGRGEFLDIGGIGVIDDSYNASPLSVITAINRIASMKATGKKIVVLGNMLGFGSKADYYHRELASEINTCGIDGFVTCGDNMKILFNSLHHSKRIAHFSEVSQIDPFSFLKKDDLVLIKGSNGMKMNVIIDKLRGKLCCNG